MAARRIVTGHDREGRSMVVRDDQVQPVELSLLPGVQFFPLWGSDAGASFDPSGGLPSSHGYFPPPGGARFAVTVIHPESRVAPPDLTAEEKQRLLEQGLAEANARLPVFLEHFEPDNPGFHTTGSVDFVYIATGRVLLEMTSGEPVELEAGDTVIQNGTRHRWRVLGDEPVTLVAVILGVERGRP